MGSRENSDDEDFSDLYKEYTGPLGSKTANYDTSQERLPASKRSHSGPEEEEDDTPDPNAVPTDFTSREAKVWEAKSKANERNWKKRKEEEFICKICGESGHFTQGCPSTLGASRTQDFFERVAAREPHVKALFTEKVVSELEKDIGCKIKIEEKFIIVSGKDRLVLKKGVDAVHKIKEEGEKKGSSSSQLSRSRSPERRSPVTSRLVRSDSQRSNPSPQGPPRSSHLQNRSGHDMVMEDGAREDLHKSSRSSSKAYGNEGVRRQSSHSRSPARPLYQINSYNSIDSHSQSQSRRDYRAEGWETERRASDMQPGHKFEYPAFPPTLEELEIEYKREATELARMRDKEEDEENYRHREAVREIRESYMKKLAYLREAQAKQWDEFLQLDAQKRQSQVVVQQHMPGSGFVGGYKQSGYRPEYENPTSNHHYPGNNHYSGIGSNMAMDSRGRYPSPVGNSYNPSRPQHAYDDFQHQRRDDYGKAYNRY